MATRTLGIKFEIAGLSEARNSLKQLKTELNNSLVVNKKALSEQVNSNIAIANSEEKRAEVIKKTNQKIFFSYLGLRANVKRQSQGILVDTQKSIRKSQRQFNNSVRDYFIDNFGSKVQKQQLIIRQEKGDFRQRSTYRGLDKKGRIQVLETRLLFKEFVLDLKKIVNEDLATVIQENIKEVSNSKSSLEKFTNVVKAPFVLAAKSILSPIEAIIFGGLQKIGEDQVTDFAEGISSQMQKSMGLQFREVGQDIGGAIGSSIYLAYEKISTATKNSLLDRHPVSGSNEILHVTKLFDDLGKVMQGFMLNLGTIPIKVKKRIDLDKKAIPQVKERAGELMINRKLTQAQEEEIQASKSITVLTGGANYDEQAGTTDFAYRSLQPMLRGSYVHPVKNLFSNAQGSEEFDKVFGQMMIIGLNNAENKQELLEFAKEQMAKMPEDDDPKNNFTEEDLDAVFTGDAATVAKQINKFAKKIHLPLPKILEVVFKGYNPDDIAMAAEGIFLKEKFPDKPLQFMGTSFGGFNAAGAAEIMERMGYEDILGVGVTTPLVGMESTVNPDNYMSSIGDLDFLYEMTLGEVFKGKVPKPDNLQVVPGKGKGHLLGHFLAQSPEFRNYLQYFLKGRADIPSMEEYTGKEVMAMGRISGDNAESAIVRTIKKGLGEKHDDGYTFNAEDLIGHRDHLTRLAGGKDLKKIKNPQLKEFYQDYISFLDTLVEELETLEKFEQIGKKFKPLNSLQKAANFYPDLGHFIPNHPDYGMSEKEFQEANEETERKKTIINFKRKIKNESPNIERTYRAILGEDISEQGYGYYDEEEYQTRATEHLGGLIGYLENDMLKDATPSEKAEALPYLKLLKKLQKTIVAVGETGFINPKEIKEAEKLLGISLKEYQEVLKENKAVNVKNDRSQIKQAFINSKKSKKRKSLMETNPELEAYVWAINQELIKQGKDQIDPNEAIYLGSGYKNHAIKANNKVYKFDRHTNPLGQQLKKIVGGKKKNEYKNEIKALKHLKGKNAPEFIAGNDQFMVMTEAEGITLKEALDNANSAEKIELLKKAAELLKSFHEKGVTHFDFHPGNIIKQNDGNLVAIDWQVAKITKDKQQHYYDRELAVSRFQDVLKDNKPEVAQSFNDAYYGKSSQPKTASSFETTKEQIVNAYNKQLRKIIENTAKQAQSDIARGNVPTNVNQSYQLIREKIAEYRRRLSESSFEEARRIGEELLVETESLKQVFRIAKDNRAGQLTRIQNEIISGDKARGRANVGLASAAYQSGARQLEIDFESIPQAEAPKVEAPKAEEVDLDSKEIMRLYGEYIQSIINNSREVAKSKIEALSKKIPDLNIDIEKLFDDLENPPKILEKIKEYKKAVKDNRALAAKFFGEQLLEDLQIQKILINQVATDIANNIDFPEFKRQEGLNKAQKSIENISSTQRKLAVGNSSTKILSEDAFSGLMQLAQTEEFQTLIKETNSLGRNARDGFDLGLNDQAENIIISFVDTIVSEGEEGLEIKSPSKIFTWIGRMVKEGFGIGANGTEAGKNFAKDTKESTEEELEIESPSRVFERIGLMAKEGFNQGIEGIGDNLEAELENVSFSPYLVVDEKNIASILKNGYKIGRKSQGSNSVDIRKEFENTLRPDHVDKNINALYGLILPTNQLKPEYLKGAMGYGGKNPYLLKLRDSILEKSTLTVGDSLTKNLKNYDASPTNIKKMFQHMIETGESYLEFQYWAKERGSLIVDEIISLGNNPSQKTKNAALEYSKPMRWKELSFDNPLKPFDYIDSNNYQEINAQINAGFNLGHSAYKSGIEFGKELIEGAKDSLGIHSPSDLFEWIGSMVKKGFELGVTGIFGTVEDELSAVDEVVGEAGVGAGIDNFLADGIDNISNFFEQLETSFPMLKQFKSALVGVFGIGLQAFGIYSLSQALGDLIRTSLETAMGIESLDRSILAVSGNAISGAKNLTFITDEARRMQIDISSAKQAYTGLLGATKDTPLQSFATEQIFSAFAKTAKIRGYSPDQTSRVFAAIEQSIGKRSLQSEEVKGQLSEVMGDIQGLIAQSLGVDVSQLNNMMREGLSASDVWLKVASQLNAQNALLASSTQTATSAMTRYKNAVTEFQAEIGKAFQPFQKLGLNAIAKSLDWLRLKANGLLKVLISLSATVGVNLFLVLINSRTALILLGQGLDQLIKLIVTALPKLLIFLRRFILISAAIETWSNVLKLSKNDYSEAEKDIEKLTLGVQALSKAYGDATDSKTALNNSKLELQEGAELPDNWFGKLIKPVVGGDRLNLDNLVRNRYAGKHGKYLRYGPLGFFAKDSGVTTQAERKQHDFLAASGETRFRAGQVLNDKYRVAESIKELAELDAQRRDIESARNALLPGDAQGYRDSLDAEKALLEERDKLLKRTSQYQQNLDTSIQALKRRLTELAQLDLQGGDTEDKAARAKERTSLLSGIEELETEKKAVNKQLSKLTKSLSAFDRSLRNSNERISGFNENQDRLTQQQRTGIIETGVDLAKGDRIIQIELDDLSRRDLRRRISNLKGEIGKLEKDVKRPTLAPGVARITKQLSKPGIGGINESSLNRIIKESTLQQDKDAAKALLALRNNQASLYQYQEQLAQSLQSNRTTLIDFNRTIADYFFRLTQEIKEAQVEIKRLISQLFYGDIKSKLRNAIAPGSESFLNGIIESVQGVIDQAASIAEKVLGQDSALIGFETKQYDLQTQLQDFARQIAGASDAVRGFIGSLGSRGAGAQGRRGADSLTALRRAIIGKESGANFKAVNPHSGALGYGQVMPANVASWTKAALGKSLTPQQFLGSAQAQIKTIDHKLNQYLQRELKATGNNLGLSVRRVASTWYSGRPKLYDDARPQTYGAGSYPSIRDYTKDILRRFQKEKGTNAGMVRANTPTVNDNYPDSFTTSNNNILNKAQKLNQQRLAVEADQIDLKGLTINLDRQNLKTDINQQTGKNARQFENQAREAERAAQQMRDRFTNLGFESQLPTAENELDKNISSKQTQFRDFDNEIFQQLQKLTDFVRTAQNFLAIAPQQIAQLRATGTEEGTRAANFLQTTLDQTVTDLPGYLDLIEEIAKIQKDLPKAQAEALKFINWQGKLKIEQQELNKQALSSQLKLNIATARGTNEDRRQLEIKYEKLRLEKRINEIKLQYGESDFAQKLIAEEQLNSQVAQNKIDYDAVNRGYQYEQQLLDLQNQQRNKQAQFKNYLGLNFKGASRQKQSAQFSEELRFRQQITKLEFEFKGDPSKLKLLREEAEKLHQINLQDIDHQFKDINETAKNLTLGGLNNFFGNLFTNLYGDGKKRERLLKQELDYSKQIIDLENKYRHNPTKLAQMKNRVNQLNDEKLDQINNEFNLFTRVLNFAQEALNSVLKEIANLAAKNAAGAIYEGIFGDKEKGGSGLLGSLVGGLFGGGKSKSQSKGVGGLIGAAIGGFFKDGGTIPGVLSSRIVPSSFSDVLQTASKPLQSAFSKEGSRGVLGVFTPGEEILSLRTGEAQRYQALKSELGISPLSKIGNFANGGTILNGFSTPRFRFDASSLNGKTNNTRPSQVINVSPTFVTPNADSFRASEYQLQQDLAETVGRASRR